jgi:hypothetical protein
MSYAPPSRMLKEEDEDVIDPDTRNDSDGRRQHDAEFYKDENDHRGKEDNGSGEGFFVKAEQSSSDIMDVSN